MGARRPSRTTIEFMPSSRSLGLAVNPPRLANPEHQPKAGKRRNGREALRPGDRQELTLDKKGPSKALQGRILGLLGLLFLGFWTDERTLEDVKRARCHFFVGPHGGRLSFLLAVFHSCSRDRAGRMASSCFFFSRVFEDPKPETGPGEGQQARTRRRVEVGHFASPSRRMSSNQPGKTSLPQSKVKKMMRTDPDVNLVTKEAVALTAKATVGAFSLRSDPPKTHRQGSVHPAPRA